MRERSGSLRREVRVGTSDSEKSFRIRRLDVMEGGKLSMLVILGWRGEEVNRVLSRLVFILEFEVDLQVLSYCIQLNIIISVNYVEKTGVLFDWSGI